LNACVLERSFQNKATHTPNAASKKFSSFLFTFKMNVNRIIITSLGFFKSIRVDNEKKKTRDKINEN